MKKRLMLSLMTVALVAMLASGATFALFTDQTTNANNTFSAGTVDINDPLATSVNIGPLAPGAAGDVGEWEITYSGTLDAWLGLTASTSGDLFSGTHPVDITITDSNNNDYDENTAKQVMGKFSQNDSVTLDVDYSWSIDAGNEYQGADGELNLQVFAVQADNNTNSAGDGPIDWN